MDEQSNSLVTMVCRPNIGSDGYAKLFEYDIPLYRLDEDWARHMSEKNWVGDKGLQDLERALSDLKEELGSKRLSVVA